MIGTVPAPVLISDPADPRVADFRDLVAGDRRPGTPRGTGPVIVEGVPAGGRLRGWGRGGAGAGPAGGAGAGDRGGRAGRAAIAGLHVPRAGGLRRPRPGGRARPAGRGPRLRGRQVGAVGGDRLPA